MCDPATSFVDFRSLYVSFRYILHIMSLDFGLKDVHVVSDGAHFDMLHGTTADFMIYHVDSSSPAQLAASVLKQSKRSVN